MEAKNKNKDSLRITAIVKDLQSIQDRIDALIASCHRNNKRLILAELSVSQAINQLDDKFSH